MKRKSCENEVGVFLLVCGRMRETSCPSNAALGIPHLKGCTHSLHGSQWTFYNYTDFRSCFFSWGSVLSQSVDSVFLPLSNHLHIPLNTTQSWEAVWITQNLAMKGVWDVWNVCGLENHLILDDTDMRFIVLVLCLSRIKVSACLIYAPKLVCIGCNVLAPSMWCQFPWSQVCLAISDIAIFHFVH